MLAVPGRHRSLALLGGVLLAQVLLLAVQIRRDTQHVRLIRVWAVGMVTPFERAGTWTITKVRGTWNGYIALVHTHRDDQELKAENDRLKIQNAELQGQSGVVGKVLEVYGHVSNVLEITDRESGVGALTADSRIQGPVGGTGEPLMVMKYVSNDETVNVGQQVLTSGQDQIFPKDLPVGTITEVKPGPPPFKLIRVKPAAHLDSLEEVMVLLTRQELNIKPAPATIPAAPAAPTDSPVTPPLKR